MTKKSTPIINHFVAQIELTSYEDTVAFVEQRANELIQKLNFHCVQKVSHKFSPQGVTLCFILSESHLVIHTWPEYNNIHIDLFTCSSHTDIEFEEAIEAVFKECGIVRIDTFKMVKNGN